MRTTLSLLAVLAFGLLAPLQARAGSLVSNGGFETGDFTGWTLSGNTANQATDWGVDNTDPHSGTYEAFFGAVGSPITLSQTLATTIGQTYEIGFWLDQSTTPTSGYNNSFSAMLGKTTLTSLTDASMQPYTEYIFTEKATSNSTLLKFSFRNDAGYWDIDDISTKTVPEPTSLLLIATGLGALYYLRQRRATSC